MAGRSGPRDWARFDHIDIQEAARRLEGIVRRTSLEPLDLGDPRIDLRGKMENLQETGSFKARGAWNQVSRLTDEQRRRGVVAPSSGNHGKALAWAAQRAGVPSTIVMPRDAFPNKIEACRGYGADVVLTDSREAADGACRSRIQGGATLIHPYDAERTIQGAGTVGLEIVEQWPEVEVVILPVGGGGLISGSSLAIRRSLGERVKILGAEPKGAPSMSRGLEAGKPVILDSISTAVQGLCPPYSGQRNVDICRETLDDVVMLDDDAIFRAQARLVAGGRVVEPAGSASSAVVFSGLLPEEWLTGRSSGSPLRVAVVVSGGNPDPAQLEEARAAGP